MKRFEVGKKYSMRSICNYDCVWTYTVVARTEKTVTLEEEGGKTFKCRINKYLLDIEGIECVYPLGRYSMCPILRAAKCL